MLFVTSLDIIPGKTDEVLFLVKTVKPPEGIKIREFLQLFGKPDFVIIFEALSENDATDFILKFVSSATPETSLANPVERIT